eukprot:182796-Prymnesium_polylepis.1
MDGARFLGVLWIVCAHFASRANWDPATETGVDEPIWKAHVGVCFFIIAAGFGMHYSQGKQRLLSRGFWGVLS